MKLLTKFNLVFIAVFSLGLLSSGYFAYALLQRNAREEVVRNARIMMETAMASRSYTTKQIKPLLNAQLKDRFVPQTVPAYAATENFTYLRKKYPDYFYKEATLNPTNLRDLAAPWEANIVNEFRKDKSKTEIIGIRTTEKGDYLYLARPIVVKEKSCLTCHTTPKIAPPTQLAVYGKKNGFGWKLNETIGAQVLAVPTAVPVGIANQAFKALLISLVGVFGFTLIALNIMLRYIVIAPVTQLSRIADEISKGNMEVEDVKVSGHDEISVLAGSFNRMHRSLKQAIQMLDE